MSRWLPGKAASVEGLADPCRTYTSYAATAPLVAVRTRRQISEVLIDHARRT